MSSKTATYLGCLGAFITFLLTAQAAGADGVDMIPPFVWLIIGGFGSVINFATGKMNPGSDAREEMLRSLSDMTHGQRERVLALPESSQVAAVKAIDELKSPTS